MTRIRKMTWECNLGCELGSTMPCNATKRGCASCVLHQAWLWKFPLCISFDRGHWMKIRCSLRALSLYSYCFIEYMIRRSGETNQTIISSRKYLFLHHLSVLKKPC